MYMIKCFWFLKSLKQLFIISLISFFGLLVNSFVNADYVWNIYNVDEDFSVPNALVFTNKALSSSAWILQGAWMPSKPLFLVQWYLNQNSTSNYRTLFYWDTNNELNYLCNTNYNQLSWFYNIQLYKFIKFSRFSWTWFVNYSPSVPSFSNYWEVVWVNSFYNDVSLKGALTRYAIWFNTSSASLQNAICFVYDNLGFSICWIWYCSTNTSYWQFAEKISVPVGASIDPVEFNTSLIWISPWVSWSSSNPWGQVFTPWTWSRLEWRLVINSWYTNSDMIKWYECVGLHPALCYWWFDIDNIFDPSEQYEDFTWYRAGQGATIFEIYNLYSWSFTSLKQFLDTVLTRYKNWQINSFKTEPKALLMLWAQMNTAWFKTSYIETYCNLLLNNNNDDVYSWWLYPVDDLRATACLRSQEVWDSLKYWVDDVWFQTTTWWIFSWEDIDFNPDTFFSNIMNKIETSLNQDFTSWSAVWLIPWYIVVALLWLVFIRLISH